MLTYCLVCLQPDGHCMYRAVRDQLSLHGSDQQQQAATTATSEEDHQADDVTDLRKKTANYIRNHRDDFLPFLTQVSTFPHLSAKLSGRWVNRHLTIFDVAASDALMLQSKVTACSPPYMQMIMPSSTQCCSPVQIWHMNACLCTYHN